MAPRNLRVTVGIGVLDGPQCLQSKLDVLAKGENNAILRPTAEQRPI